MLSVFGVDLSATRESLVQYLAQACGGAHYTLAVPCLLEYECCAGCIISGEMLLLSALSSVTARTQARLLSGFIYPVS